jgi:hypothetical protein
MPRRVDFTAVNNPMLKFLLEDGTELNIQVVLMRVTRTDDKLPDGQYRHEFTFQNVIDQVAPEGEINVKKLTGKT